MDRNTSRWLILVFFNAVLLRVLMLLAIFANDVNGFFDVDSHEYWQIAQNLVRNGSFSQSLDPPLMPDHLRTPVYPFFLAAMLFGSFSVPEIIFVQILISAAIAVIVALGLQRITTDRWIPVLGAAIVAFDIPSISYSNLLLTESLFTFLLISSFALLLSHLLESKGYVRMISSGLLMGLCCLCRPIALLLPAILFLFVYRSGSGKKPRALYAVAYLLSCSVVISPWLIRNKLVFGSTFLSTVGDSILLHYQASGVYAVRDHISLIEAQEVLERQARVEFQGEVSLEPIRYSKFQRQLGLNTIWKDPGIYLRNCVRSTMNLFFRPLRNTIDIQLGLRKQSGSLETWGERRTSPLMQQLLEKTSALTVALVFIQIGMLLLLWTSFIYGLISLWKTTRVVAVSLLLVIVYFSVISAGADIYARFRVPLIPFLAMPSAIGIGNFFNRRRS